jgi:hypothetical protein
MSKVGTNKILVLIGMRNSGKSCLTLDYLAHHTDLPSGMIICPTEDYNQTYTDRVPAMFIHDEMTPEVLEQFIKRQENRTIQAKTDPTVDPRAFLVLDDCMADIDHWANNSAIKFLFLNGRDINITLIITLMDPVGIPRNLRERIDYLFLFKNTNRHNRKKLYAMYGSMFPNCDTFESAMIEYCDDHSVLVLHRNGSERAYWYRANMTAIKSFRACDAKYWECQENIQAERMRTARLERLKSHRYIKIPLGTVIRKLNDIEVQSDASSEILSMTPVKSDAVTDNLGTAKNDDVESINENAGTVSTWYDWLLSFIQ